MADGLRICHVITRMIVGGAQENTLLSAQGLSGRGHDVTLLTGPTAGPEGKLFEYSENHGLEVVEEPSLVRRIDPLKDIKALQQLEQYFKSEGFDVIHTHSSKAGVLGRIAAVRAGCPCVVHTVHGQPFHPYQSWFVNKLFKFLERFAAKRCDKILAVCEAMIEQCVRTRIAPRQKYEVVYSGMDLEPYRRQSEVGGDDLRDKLGIPSDVPVVGKIARLFDLKGHAYLLDAAEHVVARFPETRFLLVGDGNLRPKLEEEVASRGLSENFVFAGLVDPEKIPRYVALMDVVVHLSLREGLPRSLVQGFAAGKPAVAFALDGAPEVVHHGKTGFLCHPDDSGMVATSVIALLEDLNRASEMGKRGQEFVMERFDGDRMVDRIEDCYKRILKEKGIKK